jgi:hypothetical protein
VRRIKEKELKTRNKITMMAAAGVVTLLAAGCGSAAVGGSGPAASPASSDAAASPPAVAANPVAITRQAGAKPPAGAVLGDHDVYGDRMADGSFSKSDSGESLIVYTSADRAGYTAEAARIGAPDDSHAVILIPGKLAVISVSAAAAWDDQGNIVPKWTVKPAKIAARVHGHLISGQ